MTTIRVSDDNCAELVGRRVLTIYGALFPTVEGVIEDTRFDSGRWVTEVYVRFDEPYEGMQGQWTNMFYENAHREIGHHLLEMAA